jgi:hypothetical protein
MELGEDGGFTFHKKILARVDDGWNILATDLTRK